MSPDPKALTIARLEGRVAALESALERRSLELRRLQGDLATREAAAAIARGVGGGAAARDSPFDPEGWHETTELTSGEVEDTLAALWRSLGPATSGEGEGR